MYTPDLLAGRNILITGGGSGLGAAMARRFAELGASLELCGRREGMLEQTAEAIRVTTGAKVNVRICDIRDAQAVEAMFELIWQDQPVDVLVNNAAATFVAQTEHLSARAADAILAPTLHGGLYCSLAAGRRWIAAGPPPEPGQPMRGVILSILSTTTITGRPFTVPSAMAKSGMLAMTRSLAVEWGPKGIRCVAIAPGPFPTPGATQQMRPQGRTSMGADVMNPLRRVGEHHELANLAAYLVSPHAAYINGEMVTIDGGAHLRTSGAEDLLHWSDEQWQNLRAQRSRG